MRSVDGIGAAEVLAFYDGIGGTIVELVMGEQAHIGGLDASLELAALAGIGTGQSGIDLGCNNGGGMRALMRFCGVDSMTGVDISPVRVERARSLCQQEGVADRARFVIGDACESGLPDGGADFVWSEDAWIYVADKAQVVSEAARLVRSGGMIAFTDWVEGPIGLGDEEASLVLTSMSFPSIETIDGYVDLLGRNQCDVSVAEDTGRFGAFMERYTAMLEGQHKYDALRLLDFDEDALAIVTDGFRWLAELGNAGKMAQARFVATR